MISSRTASVSTSTRRFKTVDYLFSMFACSWEGVRCCHQPAVAHRCGTSFASSVPWCSSLVSIALTKFMSEEKIGRLGSSTCLLAVGGVGANCRAVVHVFTIECYVGEKAAYFSSRVVDFMKGRQFG